MGVRDVLDARRVSGCITNDIRVEQSYKVYVIQSKRYKNVNYVIMFIEKELFINIVHI